MLCTPLQPLRKDSRCTAVCASVHQDQDAPAWKPGLTLVIPTGHPLKNLPLIGNPEDPAEPIAYQDQGALLPPLQVSATVKLRLTSVMLHAASRESRLGNPLNTSP